MSISGIGSVSVFPMGSSSPHGLRKGQDPGPVAGPTDDIELLEQPAPADEPAPVQTASDDTEGMRAAGVLRNLMAGHYKGVADVRLRINFHEELMAMQNAATRQSGTAALGDLSAAVGSALEALAGGEGLSAEQQQTIAGLKETFDQAVADAGAAYAGGEAPDAAALKSAVQEAFDALMGALGPLLAPPEPDPIIPLTELPLEEPLEPAAEPPADAAGQPPIEPPTEPVSPLEDTPVELVAEPLTDPATEPVAGEELAVEEPPPASPLDVLRAAFAAALEALDAGLTPVSLLPPLSLPNGNGGAYEKFLAIYNSLQAPPAPAEPVVDVQA